MIIQIYEIQTPQEAKICAKLGVDHVGVLVGKGKFFKREVSYTKTRQIFKVIPKTSKKLSLSLSEDINELIEVVKNTHPDILHIGAEPKIITPSKVRKLKQIFPSLKIMSAIPVQNKASIKTAQSFDKISDYLLLDTWLPKTSIIGATGKPHNWNIDKTIVKKVSIPCILAGGLGPDNVARAIKTVKPYGVDSKTKTDGAKDRKSPAKIKQFIANVKKLKY